MIFGPLEPYLLYIKLTVAALAVSIAFGAGWKVARWQCDAARTADAEATAAAVQEDIEQFKRNSALAESFATGQRDRYLKDKTTMQGTIAALEEEIKNAPLNTVTPRTGESLHDDEPFNLAFLRDWNAPIRAVNKTLRDPEAGPGVLGADTTAARVTREDVLQNHRKIVGLFGDCKVKQDYVIEFDKKYRPYMGDK